MPSLKTLSLTLLTLATLLFSGCSSKKYFEPEQTFSASSASASYGGNMVDLSRNGGTLESGQYIGKSGVSSIKLTEGYRFLNENSRYILTANAEGILNVIDKKIKNLYALFPSMYRLCLRVFRMV